MAGWGHKPTADKARRLANLNRCPYLAFEDGFLRSVNPGNGEASLSLVLDRSGIYYDARQPSDLEAWVRKRSVQAPSDTTATRALDLLRTKRLSKYNSFSFQSFEDLDLPPMAQENCILVVDQTSGDASISGAYASAQSFSELLIAAVIENPQAFILVKVHPETIVGRKAGHFSPVMLESLKGEHNELAKAIDENRLRLTAKSINPWALFDACRKVYCVSSQLGFEALMAGCQVVCFGVAYYSGYGLTDDRNPMKIERRLPASLEALFSAIYFDYSHYFGAKPFRKIDFFEAAELLQDRIGRSR